MNLDDLKNAGDDPDLIPGIYNYCDRWCERCYLSSHCLVFKMEMQETQGSDSRDISNQEFWENLSDMFSLTREMINEMAEEKGIDVESLKEDTNEKIKVDSADVQDHPVSRAADLYFESSHQWLHNNRDRFSEVLSEYEQLINLNINRQGSADSILIIKDLIDIISWYHTMIPVKSKRAVMSSMDEFWDEDDFQNDMNGTAKVVIKCIERSTFAWNGILTQFPDQEEEAMKNLSNLEWLKTNITKYFPNAEKFIRPGFDENISQ